jgi:hypothetical protein
LEVRDFVRDRGAGVPDDGGFGCGEHRFGDQRGQRGGSPDDGVSSFPLSGGISLFGAQTQQAVGSLFLGGRTEPNASANQAGYHGTLPQDFVMTGHSAGGGLVALAAGDYAADLGANPNHLLGVVMLDGVASDSSASRAR